MDIECTVEDEMSSNIFFTFRQLIQQHVRPIFTVNENASLLIIWD